MKNMTELTQYELCNVNGGNNASYMIGAAVGNTIKTILTALSIISLL
jgi:hypothetical protein